MDYARLNKITKMAELDELTTWPWAPISRALVTLELPNMNEERVEYWQSNINQHLSACGCKEGQIFVAGFLGGYVLYLFLHPSPLGLSGWGKILAGLGVTFLGALVGKVVGLSRAKILLRRTIRRLKVEMTARPADMDSSDLKHKNLRPHESSNGKG